MRFGCATKEIGRISALAEMGYDYVELGFRALAPLEDDLTFATARDRILDAPIRPEAMSGFIPPYVGLKVVGPEVDRSKLRRYLDTMLSRASQVGTKIAVFGAGASRTLPEGFPRAKALDQLRDFLALGADLAAARGIILVLEPLNRGETNLINTVDEAVDLVKSVGRPALRATVDYYHLLADGQSLEQLRRAGPLLAHAHTADSGRQPPGSAGSDQPGFLAALRAIGYDARLSVECRFESFGQEAPAALTYLRGAWLRSSGR